MVLQWAGHGLPLLQAKNLWVYIRSSLWMQGETWKRNLKVRTIFNAMSILNSNLLGSSFWWGRILGHGYFCLFICCLFCCLFFMNYQLQSLLSLDSRLPIYKLWVLTPLWQSPSSRFHYQFWTSLANFFITIYTSHLTSCCQVRKSQFSSCPNSLEVNLVANSNIRSSATQVSSDSSNNLLVPQCDGLSILWMQLVCYISHR
jgi:hypothetical protein